MSSGKKNDEYTHGTGQQLYKRAKELIPGGTQLLSKRPELYCPDIWPAYYKKAKGCRVWDMDDNEYIDMSIMGIGSCILGYADEEVDTAVVEAIKKGQSSTLNCPEEVELAELLTGIHPWAHMVRYARSGGEAMSMAVRIARAKTNREIVFFSGYHGWTDWYLAANLSDDRALDGQLMPGLQPRGIPRGLAGTARPFSFSDIAQLKEKIVGEEDKIAAFVVEPARGEEAPKEYLLKLNEIAEEIGAIVIYDEITSGFRMCTGGIHLRYGINPDIAVFAKSMANGYAMAAVIGKESVMQAAQKTFISSTNWTERIGPVAALATIRKYQREQVDKHIITIGNAVQNIWKDKSEKYQLGFNVTGIPTLCHLGIEGDLGQHRATLFCIEMLQRGFLGFRQFKPSFAHTMEHIALYEKAVDDVFKVLSETTDNELETIQPAHTGFFRLTKE